MKIVDLTYPISEATQGYPGKTHFLRTERAHYEQGYMIEDMTTSTGIGTHMDSPAHFKPGGETVDQIPLERLNGPGCVFHFQHRVKTPDYAISADDILEWEKEYGKIPQGAIVFGDTGWGKLYGKDAFIPIDGEGRFHYPGFGKSAADLLLERKVKGVGIDTISADIGLSTDFEVHKTLLPAGIFLMENIANLHELPATGTHVWIVPIKIVNSAEAPIRAFAIL